MKKILAVIGIVIVSLIILFFGISLFLPDKLVIERSIEINAPAEKVWPYVADFSNYHLWSPWMAMDPTMQFEMGAASSGVGGSYSWKSKSSGSGSQKILSEDPMKLIIKELDFGQKDKASNFHRLEVKDNSVVLTEGFEEKAGMNPINKYMHLMIKGMIGKSFEQGLAKIKELSEKN